jgi:hypothetical protein
MPEGPAPPVDTSVSTPKLDLPTYYNGIQTTRGFSLAPHHIPLCQGLEDKRIDNVLFMGPQGTGKSTILSCVYPTYALGLDPTLAVLSISAGERLPQTFMLASMQIIQHDPVFRRTFPNVTPDLGTGWSLDRGLFVTGHHPGDENPSYFSCGLASKALTGLHARLMILDDLHDEENSRTPESRAAVVDRYYRTILGRADARGCRRVAAGRWWANDDLYQELIQSGEWVVMSLPASRSGNRRLWYDVYVPKGLACTFSETGIPEPRGQLDQTGAILDSEPLYDRFRVYYGAADPLAQGFYWPASPSKRRDYNAVRRRQPRIAAINWNGDLSAAEDAVFTAEDFRPYVLPFAHEELAQGRHSPAVHAFTSSFKGAHVESAWDTAFGQRQSEALTVDITGLFVPCTQWHRGEDPTLVGPCDFHFDVYLLDMMADTLDFRELALAFRTRYGLWGPRRVTVEEKASGISLLQTFRGSAIPLRGQRVAEGKIDRAINPVFTPGSATRSPGVRAPHGVGGGAASVQGWARMGRILYPAGAPWTQPSKTDPTGRPGWLHRMLNFTGGTRNADEFDATVHLITRAITLSVRSGRLPTGAGEGGNQDVGAVPDYLTDPYAGAREALAAIAALQAPSPQATANSLSDPASNPFHGFCGGGCGAYGTLDNSTFCLRHNRRVTTFDGCADWSTTPPAPEVTPAWDNSPILT